MRIAISLDTVTAYNTGSEGDAQPFLWPVFFKVDEFALKTVICKMRERGEQVGLLDFLASDEFCAQTNWFERRAWIHGPGGGHGNLPEMDDGDTVEIPAWLGRWEAEIEFQQLNQINAAGDLCVGCIAVLLEEDALPTDETIREMYNTFISTVRERLNLLLEAKIREQGGFGPQPVGSLDAYLWADNESKHVLYRGHDQHIHELNWKSGRDGSDWRHQDLSQITGSHAAIGNASGDPNGFRWEDQHVFFQSSGSIIRQLQYTFGRDGDDWTDEPVRLFSYDLTDPVETPRAAGRLACYAWGDRESMHVFYRGDDDHIHELNWRRNRRGRRGIRISTKWFHYDLTEETGARIAPAGDPAAFVWQDDESHRVFYRGADDHIHELRKSGGDNWVHLDLTDRAEAPAAAGDPCAYVWTDDESLHVFYRGTDNHIHELHWRRGRRGSNWRHNDLTAAAAGAPDAAGDPAGYVWQDDETQHIFYRGDDNHIHELHWRRGREGPDWRHNDLTAAAPDAISATGNPAAFVWDDEESQHVFYTDENAHVHELNWKRSRERNAWRDIDLSVESGLANEDGDNGNGDDDLSSAQLEAEITRSILNRMPGIFVADDLIGVGVWLWTIGDLRDRMDPSSGRLSEPFSRRWNQTSGPIRGDFPDDWEISGTLEVND